MARRPNRPARIRPYFVKVICKRFSKKLLIPRKYVMLHRETLGKECVLWPTHTSDSWRVRTKCIDDELYFKKGWKKFAKHHSLQFGDMLIFRHVQNSEFDVDVVDKSCIPRKTLAFRTDQVMKDSAPVPTSRKKKAILQTAALTAAEALIASSEYPSFYKIMKSAYVGSGGYLHVSFDFSKEYMKDYSGYVKIRLSESKAWMIKVLRQASGGRTLLSAGWSNLARENSLQVNDVCVFQLINTKDYTFQLTIFKHISGGNQKHKNCKVKLKSSDSEPIPKSKKNSDKAFEEAERFKSMSKHHSIITVMHPAYVKRAFLHVPSAFHNYMCKEEGENEVRLQCLGKERKVIMRNVREQCRISKGWGAFVKENSIELIPPKFVRLHRGTLPRKCMLRPSHTQESWPVRVKQMSNFLYFKKGWRKFAQFHSLKSCDLLVFRYAQDSVFYVDMFDESCCSKKLVTSQNVNCRTESSPTFVSHKKPGGLIAAEELMASSEFPKFILVMQPIYVKSGGYMHVPQEFANTHLEESPKELKIEVGDKTWSIGIVKDRRSRRLTKGWCPFVRENGLKLGDVCVFQLTNAQDFTLKLTIFSSTT
ncbi:hypothetical protein ACET3Z_011130 [Daucus carota]